MLHLRMPYTFTILFCSLFLLSFNITANALSKSDGDYFSELLHNPKELKKHSYEDLNLVDSTNSLRVNSIFQDLTTNTVLIEMEILDRAQSINVSSRRSGGYR